MKDRFAAGARVLCLCLCAGLALASGLDVIGRETGGGTMTGSLGRSCLAGGGMFLFAALLVFLRPRIAMIIFGLAAVLCVPLYLYLLDPAVIARLSSAPSSVYLPTGPVFNMHAVLGLLPIAGTALSAALPSAAQTPDSGGENAAPAKDPDHLEAPPLQ